MSGGGVSVPRGSNKCSNHGPRIRGWGPLLEESPQAAGAASTPRPGGQGSPIVGSRR